MKKLKVLKLVFIIIQVLCLILMFTNNVFASGAGSGFWRIYNKTSNPFEGTVSIVIGVIQAVGMSVAVIMLTFIGIKYILASPDGKAELKQQLFPYLIGCVLLFAGSGLIGIIANFAYSNIK